MADFKIGVLIDSFRLPLPEAAAKAEAMGISGVQVAVVSGNMVPEKLSPAERRGFLDMLASHHLEISALCGDLGGHGFQLAEENPEKIIRSKAIVDLACDLNTRVVTTHIGVIPGDTAEPVYRNMLDTCRKLGEYANKKGVTFAIETGPEPASVLAAFLDDVDSKGIGVNLDPANLVMVTNDDPVKAVDTLKKYIVHTHAKDGVHLKDCNPVAVYNAFAGEGIEGFDFGVLFNETPLGTGSVKWAEYLNALRKIGYHGYLTIERECGENPAADIGTATDFLRKLI